VYWHILAARLAFVVLFQNFVALSVMAIKVLIPNTSSELKERIRREAYLTNEIIIRTELLKAKGQLGTNEEGQGDGWKEGEDGESEDSACLARKRRRRWSLERKESGFERVDTGDITDGKIVI